MIFLPHSCIEPQPQAGSSDKCYGLKSGLLKSQVLAYCMKSPGFSPQCYTTPRTRRQRRQEDQIHSHSALHAKSEASVPLNKLSSPGWVPRVTLP